MALDIKPTRSELINLKRRIKQTSTGYNLLKMKRDGLFHEFRTLLSEMIEAREGLVGTYRDALQAINLASSIEGGLAVKSAAIAVEASRSASLKEEYNGRSCSKGRGAEPQTIGRG